MCSIVFAGIDPRHGRTGVMCLMRLPDALERDPFIPSVSYVG
jgi:hypothetical protein